jgi:hypothetical protein
MNVEGEVEVEMEMEGAVAEIDDPITSLRRGFESNCELMDFSEKVRPRANVSPDRYRYMNSTPPHSSKTRIK